MARKRKGELPSGNIRRRVFIGYEYITDDNGNTIKKRKYKSVTASSAAEANEKVLEVKSKKVKFTPSGELTFKQARENYIESMRPVLSPSTIRGYKQMNTYFTDIDNIKLKNMDSDIIQNWINTFFQTHASKTVRNGYGLINRVLSENNISGIQVKLPKKKIIQTYVPTDEEVQTIVKHFIKENDVDMVIAICLASFATLRRSEICGLISPNDVNGNIIHIHNSIVVDDENNNVFKEDVKNPTSDRYAEIPQFVVDMFPKEGKIVSISPDVITNRFGRALKKEKINHFRFHDLRHYSASVMHAIGIPDVYIMERGGWKSDETLKRIYRGTIESYKQQFVEQTNTYFENMHHACTTESEESL